MGGEIRSLRQSPKALATGDDTGFILATTYSSVAEAKVPSAIRGFPVWFGMEQRVAPAQ